ncbi:hypothetical protein EXIGLDRAFT_406555 [Exidia glandulosa HHB12029]|uniref:NADH dehydrogenase [ubiquinone] 1 beta subcomplex subunit 4 n=1 Tax=Exidia glandulosa HHB12029 TaxID=1314781 RepID=A0A165BIP2_EXIGL|nr:hypothetical protein EXIGLDRAFT_780630 [Exidia glandulosa HHB12029]KZV80751.1 hypothetical protein EXIGLDRAFT_406555 [Exidia glandulosa HHB12029]
MAGGHGQKTDPAIERWAYMRENVYKHFQFTPTAVKRVVALGIVVPTLCYMIAADQSYKWDWRGKRKGDSLLSAARQPPPADSE